MAHPRSTDDGADAELHPAALGGLRVVECGSLIAGPFCGQLLGDFGAEVIKVEDPGRGDPMRLWGNQLVDGLSLHWPIIARNKKSVTLNLRSDVGQDILRQLIAKSDILVENFRPGTLEKWGLSYESLCKDNPALILVRVSGYGQDGAYSPRAGFGSIGEAMGGIRYLTGDSDRPPSRNGVSLGDSLAAVFAMVGTLLALRARDRTGRGQVVDSAIYEAVLALMESILPEWELAGYQRERTGAVLPGVAPSNVYPTADGNSILIAANADGVYARLARLTGLPALQHANYATHSSRAGAQEELDALISDWTSAFKTNDLLEALHEAGIPAGKIYRSADMFSDPHYAMRKTIIKLSHNVLGEFPMQAPAPRLSMTPGAVHSLGPELGAHNEMIYQGLLGMSANQLTKLASLGVI